MWDTQEVWECESNSFRTNRNPNSATARKGFLVWVVARIQSAGGNGLFHEAPCCPVFRFLSLRAHQQTLVNLCRICNPGQRGRIERGTYEIGRGVENIKETLSGLDGEVEEGREAVSKSERMLSDNGQALRNLPRKEMLQAAQVGKKKGERVERWAHSISTEHSMFARFPEMAEIMITEPSYLTQMAELGMVGWAIHDT